MKTSTKLRFFGGVVLLFNIWLIGRYNLHGFPVIILTIGFAIGFEFFVVRSISTEKNNVGSTTGNQPEEPSNQDEATTALIRDKRYDDAIHADNSNIQNIEEKSEVEKHTDIYGKDDEAIYGIISDELESGKTVQWLWTKLYSEFDGDEKRTRAKYISERAAIIRNNIEKNEARRHEEETKRRQEDKERIRSEFIRSIESGNISSVRTFLDSGADIIDIANNCEKNPITIAERNSDKQMICLLLKHMTEADYRGIRSNNIQFDGRAYTHDNCTYDKLDDAIAHAEKMAGREK